MLRVNFNILLALGCFAIALIVLTPSKAFAAELGTPDACTAAGGTWKPGDSIVPIGGCSFGRAQAPSMPPPMVNPNDCISIRNAIGYDQEQINKLTDVTSARASFIASQTQLLRLLDTCGNSAKVYTSPVQNQRNAFNAVNPNGFGQTYVPITAPRGTELNKMQYANNSMAAGLAGLAFLANQEEEQEEAQQQQQEQAAEEEQEREAQEAEEKAAREAADAKARNAMSSPFAGQQQPLQAGAAPNPFAAPSAPTGAPAGTGDGSAPQQLASNQGAGVPVIMSQSQADAADSTGNPDAAGLVNPFDAVRVGDGPQQQTASVNSFAANSADSFTTPAGDDEQTATADPPNRKLGDPKQADHLPKLTEAACTTAKGEVFMMPNDITYCVIPVDQPELTNEWHYLIADNGPDGAPKAAAKPALKLKIPNPVNGVRG